MKYLSMLCAILVMLLNTSCEEELLDVNAKGTITGRVVQDVTFVPLENVKISTNPASNTVFTDANGEFLLPADVGQYAVQAQKDGFLVSFESATVVAGDEVQIVFEMKLETANNGSPSVPTAITPVDGTTNVPFNVELKWEATDPDDDDLTYTLTLRNGATNAVETFTDLVDAFKQVTVGFGTTYFWQVAASDGLNAPVNSPLFSFSTASFPTNRFHFVKKENGNNVIYSADGTPAGQVAITTNTTNSWRPRVNRTTNKIAYLRNVGAAVHVYTMNTDGSNKQQITSTVPVSGFNFDEIDIAWASNGGSIYYPSQDKLYRINIDGSGLTLIYQTTGSLITEIDVNNNVIALKTNNVSGYGVQIFTINTGGNFLQMVQTGVAGAAGGLNLSADNTRLLFTRDFSGFENNAYRQLDTRAVLHTFSTNTTVDISFNKPGGTNDLDARFSPTEASIIINNMPNDGSTSGNIQTLELTAMDTRVTRYSNAFMPDWE